MILGNIYISNICIYVSYEWKDYRNYLLDCMGVLFVITSLYCGGNGL